MPVRTRLYLCRHCDVANPGKVLYGYLPGFGLSEKGTRSKRRRWAGTGRTADPGIYTSPLERAEQTTASSPAISARSR